MNMHLSNISNVLYGFTDMKTLDERGPLVLKNGKGIYVYDIYNNKYLDANSGLWNCVAGFDHPKLIETAINQYKTFAGYHSLFGRLPDKAIELSEKLIEVSPFKKGRVFLTNSGSEANDTAVKILWMLNKRKGNPEKRKIITRLNAYHGVTIGASSMTGKPYNEEFGMPLKDFLHTSNPHYWKFGKNNETEEDFTIRMGHDLENLIKKEDPKTIAGFFAEPVMGAGGVVLPSKGYFDIIQPILKKYKIPFIADEVICGFGRTGKLWGSETYNINPDMIIASKCITAGYFPMGAVILNSSLSEEFVNISHKAEEFPHGFTSGGHPVGCSIAIKAIDIIINEGLLENVKSLSPLFMNHLEEFNSYKNIGEVRGIGFMGALEIVKDKTNKTYFDSNLSIGEKVANRSIENGLICRPIGPSIVLCPPFIISKKELNELFDVLHKTIKSVLE